MKKKIKSLEDEKERLNDKVTKAKAQVSGVRRGGRGPPWCGEKERLNDKVTKAKAQVGWGWRGDLPVVGWPL